jgi:GNAT superfamily N-acetyltransferase
MLDVRALTSDDLDAARGLSTRAGWNQTAADWKRFLTLSPGGCFAGVVDGEVVATTAVVTYGGSVSWIGMVLVDERHRSRGYGSRIFERGLEYATSEGGSVVGLDATHLGEPIYRKYGFERVEPVFRWQGTLRPSGSEGGTRTTVERVDRVSPEDVGPLRDFDREHVEVDRSALLRELLEEPDVRGYLARESTRVTGYAIVRPGRTARQIGPIVAARPETIDPLLRAVARQFEGQSVIVDAPGRVVLSSALERRGLARDRELVRMTSPEPESVLTTDSVYAFLDFAFG